MGARSEDFSAESIIIKEGEMKHRMYIVQKGEVILYRYYGTEDEYIIGVYGRGKTFGEFNLFSDGPNLFTAVAYNDVKVAWFERNNLDSFINGYPDLALNLFESISKSYISLAKNLKLAIDEINDIKKFHPDIKTNSSSVNYEEINDALFKFSEVNGGFRYINK